MSPASARAEPHFGTEKGPAQVFVHFLIQWLHLNFLNLESSMGEKNVSLRVSSFKWNGSTHSSSCR